LAGTIDLACGFKLPRPQQPQPNPQLFADQVLSTLTTGKREVRCLCAVASSHESQEACVFVIRMCRDDEDTSILGQPLEQVV
jgi:hypothetical protein